MSRMYFIMTMTGTVLYIGIIPLASVKRLLIHIDVRTSAPLSSYPDTLE